MRIVFTNFTDILQIGGINKNIKMVGEQLSALGNKCYVISVNPGGLKKEDDIDGIKILRLNSFINDKLYGFNPSFFYYFKKICVNEIKPEIVHIHEYRNIFSLQAAVMCRLYNIPYVFSPHYDRFGYNTLAGKYLINTYKPLGSLVLKWASKIIVNSAYTKDILIDDFQVEAKNIEIIPHGVSNPKIQSKKKPRDGVIKLLYIGVLIELKGVQYIIMSLSELIKMGERVSLTIVGDGDYRLHLEKLANKLNVNDFIEWRGSLYGEELYKVLEQSDIFLLLSRSEGYGIVVAEALASGTPCIVAETTALIEFTQEKGCYGIEYPPDPKELANLIVNVYQSNIAIDDLSEKVSSWEKIAIKYNDIYKYINNKGMDSEYKI